MYTVILDDICEKELIEIKKDYTRFDELKEAITWYLSRNPRECLNLEDGYFAWKTGKLADGLFPEIYILFMVNETEKKVFINMIKAV